MTKIEDNDMVEGLLGFREEIDSLIVLAYEIDKLDESDFKHKAELFMQMRNSFLKLSKDCREIANTIKYYQLISKEQQRGMK